MRQGAWKGALTVNNGRFTSETGREAGRKSNEGGRPTRAYRSAIEEAGMRALRKLLEIAEGRGGKPDPAQLRALEAVEMMTEGRDFQGEFSREWAVEQAAFYVADDLKAYGARVVAIPPEDVRETVAEDDPLRFALDANNRLIRRPGGGPVPD